MQKGGRGETIDRINVDREEWMPETKQHNERLIALLIVGLLALNYPLLSLFSKARLIFGVPVLYLYLFSVWYIFITFVALNLARPSSPPAMPDRTESDKAD
jgi:hypothetical protein